MAYKVTMITATECQVKIIEVNDLFCEFCGSKEELIEEGGKTICKICKKYRFTSVDEKQVKDKE